MHMHSYCNYDGIYCKICTYNCLKSTRCNDRDNSNRNAPTLGESVIQSRQDFTGSYVCIQREKLLNLLQLVSKNALKFVPFNVLFCRENLVLLTIAGIRQKRKEESSNPVCHHTVCIYVKLMLYIECVEWYKYRFIQSTLLFLADQETLFGPWRTTSLHLVSELHPSACEETKHSCILFLFVYFINVRFHTAAPRLNYDTAEVKSMDSMD